MRVEIVKKKYFDFVQFHRSHLFVSAQHTYITRECHLWHSQTHFHVAKHTCTYHSFIWEKFSIFAIVLMLCALSRTVERCQFILCGVPHTHTLSHFTRPIYRMLHNNSSRRCFCWHFSCIDFYYTRNATSSRCLHSHMHTWNFFENSIESYNFLSMRTIGSVFIYLPLRLSALFLYLRPPLDNTSKLFIQRKGLFSLRSFSPVFIASWLTWAIRLQFSMDFHLLRISQLYWLYVVFIVIAFFFSFHQMPIQTRAHTHTSYENFSETIAI